MSSFPYARVTQYQFKRQEVFTDYTTFLVLIRYLSCIWLGIFEDFFCNAFFLRIEIQMEVLDLEKKNI